MRDVMKTIGLVIAAVFASVGCAGDEPPASGNCTGQVYDLCNDEHDCTSANCHNFNAEGFQVCTQACDGSNPCPGDGECNMAGICKPMAPNACTL